MTSKRGRKPVIPTSAAIPEQLQRAFEIIVAYDSSQRLQFGHPDDLIRAIRDAPTLEEQNRLKRAWADQPAPTIEGCPPTGLPALDRALPYVIGGINHARVLPLYLISVIKDDSDLGEYARRENALRAVKDGMDKAVELLKGVRQEHMAAIVAKLAEIVPLGVAHHLEIETNQAPGKLDPKQLEAFATLNEVDPRDNWPLTPVQKHAYGQSRGASVFRTLDRYISKGAPKQTRIIIDLAALAGITIKPNEITAWRKSDNTEITSGCLKRQFREIT
ncbi:MULTISPECIES: hypothetical protein [Acidithiobacillus]|jgi:hypothetical protein|uniref:Uncharacterized protein n=1 Tax=Acidithiobacillus thiooxidans ATCC 19377 TaxID=637390 RepID=A0A5P9XU38_ACITH|nr:MULTISPECIES: hypothetical protein [Acidithiobacillus]MBU2835199.1 hypothetical protein [Acidithiobacillus thiooxidans]MDA8177457.1 hypothetical protein [Acidithiobacillus sp.]QFX97179.1 hypothetical protein GCD22_03065 [Acidithiobacillus thiooxidans ATCC 19377]